MNKDITINVTAPCECTEEEFQEWVEYNTGYSAGVSMKNPLHEYDLEANSVNI